jgi:hypothetical protein
LGGGECGVFPVTLKGFAQASAAALSLALAAAAGPAKSAVFYAIFEGQVTNGFDYAGAFGSVGALSGNYVATFKYDTSLGWHILTEIEEAVTGGPLFSVDSPILAASLQIHGKTLPFVMAGSNGNALTINAFGLAGFDGYSALDFSVAVFLPDLEVSLDEAINPDDAPTRLLTPYTGVPGNYLRNGNARGHVYWANLNGGNRTVQFEADLTPTRVVLTNRLDAFVPEPATWGLLVLGFGGAGAMLRRQIRRRTAKSPSTGAFA